MAAKKTNQFRAKPLDKGVVPGKRHAQVHYLQRLLMHIGYYIKRGPTTFYGPACQAAVKQFNEDNGFSDGVHISPRGFAALQRQAHAGE